MNLSPVGHAPLPMPDTARFDGPGPLGNVGAGLAGDACAGPTRFHGADATLGAIFRAFGGAYLDEYGAVASSEQRRVLQWMALCRTPELGTAHWECGTCGHVHEIYNPCRDRHCAMCGDHLARQWYDQHQRDLLPLVYQHLIFTAPHELQVLLDVWSNRRVLYALYLRAAHRALRRVARTQWGLRIGLALILHTWNQWQLRHVHVHGVWPLGGWSIGQPERFVRIEAGALDRQWLMRAWRDALLGALCRVAERRLLVFGGAAAFLDNGAAFCQWIEQLRVRRWILRFPEAIEGGETALGYVARYTRRIAIDNRRILEFDVARATVTFGYRANGAGPDGQDIDEVMTIPAVEFIRRYLDHVMPSGLGRTRFYGWWSASHKGTELPRIRVQLGVEPTNQDAAEEGSDADDDGKQAVDDTPPPRLCPKCKARTLERLWHEPAPPLYELMQLDLWPQQRKAPREHQALLPDLEAWVPGGAEFPASLLARTGGAPASGFT